MFCRRVGYMVVISKKSVISKKKNAFLFAGTPSQVPANFPMISPRILSFEFKSGIKIQFYKRYIWSFPSPISINHVIWTSHSLFQSLQSFLNPNELGNLVNMCLSTFENKEHLTFQICKKSNPKNLTISGSTICRFLTWNMPHSFQHVTWIIQFKEFQIFNLMLSASAFSSFIFSLVWFTKGWRTTIKKPITTTSRSKPVPPRKTYWDDPPPPPATKQTINESNMVLTMKGNIFDFLHWFLTVGFLDQNLEFLLKFQSINTFPKSSLGPVKKLLLGLQRI